MNGEGGGPLETVWEGRASGSPRGRRLLRAVKPMFFISGALLAIVFIGAAVYAVFGGVRFGPGWVPVGSLSDLRKQGVLYERAHDVFVVALGGTPIALFGRAAHLDEQVYFCESSGWFEEPLYGSKFDAEGTYAVGPARRGLDHVAIRIEKGQVAIDPGRVTSGLPRGARAPVRPNGPFCDPVAGLLTPNPATGRFEAG
jgi:hypothetical protein